MKKIILGLSVLAIFFAVSCNKNEETTGPSVKDNPAVKPQVLAETEEAKAFLALLEGKTKVVSSYGADIMTIEDGGKTLNIYGNKYSFQSAKNSTIAYYTEAFNLKNMDPSLPDKVYYRYKAFEVKDGKLSEYGDTIISGDYKGDEYLLQLFETDDKGSLKPKKDVNSMDFSPLFPRKENIDFTKPYEIGTLK